MWRYLAGGAAALLLAVAGMFLFRGSASPGVKLPAVPPAVSAASGQSPAPLPDEAPSATDKTREQKRFDRYDKDRNEAVSREEYLAARRKAFAKLDTNGDGKLDFEEWAIKATTKFAAADKDRSGTLTRTEFVATAPPQHARRTAPRCLCAGPKPAEKDEDDS